MGSCLGTSDEQDTSCESYAEVTLLVAEFIYYKVEMT